jgi:multidrug efflux pump subunit AcrA (membrane-fusion protein)
MVRLVDVQRRMPRAASAALVTLGIGVGLAGCGGDGRFANEPRPAAAITVSTAILPARVTVSPSHIGAGTVELIASNQTSTSQRVTLRSRARTGGGAPLVQSTGPINPGDTASLKANLRAGRYVVTARSGAIAPATIVVGPPRENVGDGLLQP